MTIAFALNVSCIYVTGVADYEKGTCEGPCADAAIDSGAAKCPSDMVFVQGGGYVPAGKPGGGLVDVESLCVDKTEVTEAAYRGCVAKGTCTAADNRTFCNYAIPGRDTDPINCVNVTQAKTYCTSVGKRLPTENEWEWAARGGLLAYVYPWDNADPKASDNPERLCWQGSTKRDDAATWPNRPAGTCAVGSFAAGALGIFDLAGNVWEWTSTEVSTNTFVFRGGSAFDPPDIATYKNGSAKTGASAQYPGVGMRCFKTAPP